MSCTMWARITYEPNVDVDVVHYVGACYLYIPYMRVYIIMT
jgi:hypothetical protein